MLRLNGPPQFITRSNLGIGKGANALTDTLLGLRVPHLFSEPSLSPQEYALSKELGKMANEMRLPMVPITQETEAKVRAAMAQAGLCDAANHRPKSKGRLIIL